MRARHTIWLVAVDVGFVDVAVVVAVAWSIVVPAPYEGPDCFGAPYASQAHRI